MPLFPISFCVPESKVIDYVPQKTKIIGHVIPGDGSTYVFINEEDYYNDYKTSVCGITRKKSGWDCLRHYEILMNGSVPFFIDLENCPKNTMTHFPKELVREAMTASNALPYIPSLLEYTKNNLTCRAMAQYVLDKSNCPTPKKVLFLSYDPWAEYLRDLILIGLKQILGKNCIEDVIMPQIYEDFTNKLYSYGRGFTYTCIIPISEKPDAIDILKEISNHSFDLVIYGAAYRGLPYINEVTSAYKPHEITFLCGEDAMHDSEGNLEDNCACLVKPYIKDCNVFIRELQ
jgi:hypothetical protein